MSYDDACQCKGASRPPSAPCLASRPHPSASAPLYRWIFPKEWAAPLPPCPAPAPPPLLSSLRQWQRRRPTCAPVMLTAKAGLAPVLERAALRPEHFHPASILLLSSTCVWVSVLGHLANHLACKVHISRTKVGCVLGQLNRMASRSSGGRSVAAGSAGSRGRVGVTRSIAPSAAGPPSLAGTACCCTPAGPQEAMPGCA